MIGSRARELLEQPALLGVVCTRRADGSPHATPVWFRLDQGLVRIWTDEERLWVANVKREPRVAFSVHENERPWRSVAIRGHATVGGLSQDEGMAEIRRITARYLDPSEIAGYVADWPQTRAIVTIEPIAAFTAQAFEDPVAHRRR